MQACSLQRPAAVGRRDRGPPWSPSLSPLPLGVGRARPPCAQLGSLSRPPRHSFQLHLALGGWFTRWDMWASNGVRASNGVSASAPPPVIGRQSLVGTPVSGTTKAGARHLSRN